MMHSQLPLQNAGKLSRFSITEDCADIQQGIYREELVHFYRPQRSCGKIIFSQASVSHSVHRGGVCLGACWDLHTPSRYPPGRYTPWAGTPHPPGSTPPGQVHPPGRYPPNWADTPLPHDSHCSGRYVSYWTAFLLIWHLCMYYSGIKL